MFPAPFEKSLASSPECLLIRVSEARQSRWGVGRLPYRFENLDLVVGLFFASKSPESTRHHVVGFNQRGVNGERFLE
jgi:hypothetical protein